MVKQLATMICWGLSYLMQDSMKLYGPASILFPLKTANKVFKEDSMDAAKQLAWCQAMIARLVSKGLNICNVLLCGLKGGAARFSQKSTGDAPTVTGVAAMRSFFRTLSTHINGVQLGLSHSLMRASKTVQYYFDAC